MILDDIEYALQQASVGWSIYKGYMPDEPDNLIVVYETGGQPPDQSDSPFDFPSIQVRVRGPREDYQSARSKIQECFNALHAKQITVVGVSPVKKYVYCYAIQSGPIPMGRDTNTRPELVWNFQLMVARD